MLDFTELSGNGQDLEQLTRELLFSMGYQVYWSGRGPDGGRDLICIEEHKSAFQDTSRKWLIQCKHNAKSGASVGTVHLDDIVDSCEHHECDGYLLVTSTQPSSKVVERLEGINNNPKRNLAAAYWDAVHLERMLSTPKLWAIAQRFFPTSAEGWQIYASERPNHWTANFKGYYFHITNRIGSDCDIYLDVIENKLNDIEQYTKHRLPESHFLRLRSVFYDDKCGGFRWYIDYMHPFEEKAIGTAEQFEEAFYEGDADGYDFKVRDYSENSDHYDPDHYDFYDRYMGQFMMGMFRPR